MLTCVVGNNPLVDKLARTVLAQNLSAIIRRSGMSRHAWATSKKLDVKAVERATKGLHAPRLDFLEELAAACGVETWQLLHPAQEYAQIPAAIMDIARGLAAIEDERERNLAISMCTRLAYREAEGQPVQTEEEDAPPATRPQSSTPTDAKAV